MSGHDCTPCWRRCPLNSKASVAFELLFWSGAFVRVFVTFKCFMKCSGTCVCDWSRSTPFSCWRKSFVLRVWSSWQCSVMAHLPAALSWMHAYTLSAVRHILSSLLQTSPHFKVGTKCKLIFFLNALSLLGMIYPWLFFIFDLAISSCEMTDYSLATYVGLQPA